MDIDLDRDRGRKVQLGVSGTAMPNKPKNEIRVLYVLDQHNSVLGRDLDDRFEAKIQDKFSGEPSLDWKRSNVGAIDEQAIIATLKGDSLPVQQTQINRAANTIDNQFKSLGRGSRVQNIVMDTI